MVHYKLWYVDLVWIDGVIEILDSSQVMNLLLDL